MQWGPVSNKGVCVCVCVCGGGGGVVNYKERPSEDIQYLTGLRESSYPVNHKLNNCKNK